MQAYVVRHKLDAEKHNPGELVGVFVAALLERLKYLIDAVSDAWACEYRVLGEGGLEWAGSAVTLPYVGPKDEDDEDGIHQYIQQAIDTMEFDERWQHGIFSDDGKWKSLDD